MSHVPKSVLSRIDNAWAIVLGLYLDHSQQQARNNGRGINLFKFNNTDECNYNFVNNETTIWTYYCDILSFGESNYDITNSFAVAVIVPAPEIGDQTYGQIRVFPFSV
jgi:hypothetical protein